MTGFRRLLAPAMFLTALAVFTLFSPELTRQMGLDPLAEHIRIGQKLGAYLGVAWLLSRIADMFLTDFRPRDRPVPKLLRDLLTAVLFLIALISGGMLLMGHSAGSALAGSGVVLALIGFAIRNVVADTLSGI
ncbi:MAG: mechanosensitive ion channel family protein, partial [Roseinatronobacter sp.]